MAAQKQSLTLSDSLLPLVKGNVLHVNGGHH